MKVMRRHFLLVLSDLSAPQRRRIIKMNILGGISWKDKPDELPLYRSTAGPGQPAVDTLTKLRHKASQIENFEQQQQRPG